MRITGITTRGGFTLIELSIVLVIIGLIVGGVLVGQDLIKAAGVRAIISEKDKFSAAIYTFRDKYSYLPGDFPNPNNMLGTPSNENGWYGEGNGNGIIDDEGTVGGDAHYDAEIAFFWAQLGAANMVAGSYPTGYNRALPGTNVPLSAFGSGAGWALASSSTVLYDTPTPFYVSQSYPNVFIFGAGIPPSYYFDSSNVVPVLTPADSYSIDKKIDDGLPGTGNVIVLGYPGYTGQGSIVYNCTTSNIASTATYDLTITTPTCLMLFANMW